MKPGDLVVLNGGLWSSYPREGKAGLLLETRLLTERSGYPNSEFSRVLWHDGTEKLYKTTHLEVVEE